MIDDTHDLPLASCLQEFQICLCAGELAQSHHLQALEHLMVHDCIRNQDDSSLSVDMKADGVLRRIPASSVQIKVLQRRPDFLADALGYQKQLQGQDKCRGKFI